MILHGEGGGDKIISGKIITPEYAIIIQQDDKSILSNINNSGWIVGGGQNGAVGGAGLHALNPAVSGSYLLTLSSRGYFQTHISNCSERE